MSEISVDLDRIRAEVSAWNWPARVIESAESQPDPAAARAHLRRMREAARDNILEGIALGKRLDSAGREDEAFQIFSRVTDRWGDFLDQSAEVSARLIRGEASWVDVALNRRQRQWDSFVADVTEAAGEALDTGKTALLVVGAIALLAMMTRGGR